MTESQWNDLNTLINEGSLSKPLIGFIIDSPWIPGWYGVTHLEYYTSEKIWFEANKKAIELFPDVIFLPGFWSEFGMCTEPSAFGAKCVWLEDNLPHADPIIQEICEVKNLRKPNPKTDGLLPFMIERLKSQQKNIHNLGHEIKFAVARGPLNIASFLMGTTEFMMAMMMNPEETHHFLNLITGFIEDWLLLQKEIFPGIEGILVLDDIVGFIGEEDCKNFAIPSLKKVFNAFDAKIRFFHNDAKGLVSTPYLHEAGVNLYNFSFEHSINEIRELAGNEIALLGNLPPRDVLAAGTEEEVRQNTIEMWNDVKDKSRIVWSCGGGMPPDVSTGNINSFIETINSLT